MIQHRCPNCAGLLENSESAAGWSINCRHCGASLDVPSEGTVVSEAPVPVPALPQEPIIDRIGLLIGAHASDARPVSLAIEKRIILAIGGLLIATLMGSAFIYLIYSLVECRMSANWPTVQGTVERAGVREKVGRSARGRRMVESSASVVYHYKVDSKEHISSRVTFGPQENYAFLARSLAAQYEPDQQVTVIYDPANPDYAVLRRSLQFSAYHLGLLGLFMSYAGLRMILNGVMPVVATTNSRLAPWSYRVTWLDLPVAICCLIAGLLYVPYLFGL